MRSNRSEAVEAEIAGLDAPPLKDLQAAWRRLYRVEPPIRLSRDLLTRGIAYKLQEQAYGGLPAAMARQLKSLVETPGKDVAPPHRVPALRPGTRLVREWHGRTHHVTVLADGFHYDGERYRSLTEIAHRITGAHHSGPRFFGLRTRRLVAGS